MNALAETTVGWIKTEQINRNGPWRDINANTVRPRVPRRPYSVEAEQLQNAHVTALTQAG